MNQIKQVCFDYAFSSAFTNILLENGYAKCLVGEYDSLLLDMFLYGHGTRRLRKRALEMAVIFEKFYIFGPGNYIDFSPLKREGLSCEIVNGLDTFSNEMPIRPEFLKAVKSSVIRSIHRKINRKLEYCQNKGISYLAVSGKYDSLIELAQTGYSIHQLAGNLFHTVGGLIKEELPRKYKELMPPAEPFSMNSIDRFVLSRVMSSPESFIIFSSIYEEVNILWNSFMITQSLNIPFMTTNPPNFALFPESPETKQYGAYLICQVILRDEIKYMPTIDSFDDVLRLRENKYIHNFREALWEWCNALKDGKKVAIEKITRDVRTANKDLKLLQKWERADNWVFWIETAASLVPILNYVILGETIIRRLFIKRLENRSGWLAFIVK